MGFAVLGFLFVLAALSATLAGYRLYRSHPLSALIAAMGIWMLITAVPPYVLGWLGLLVPVSVGALTAAAALGVAAVSLHRCDPGPRRFFIDALSAVGRVPIHGLGAAWRARSLVIIGPVLVVLLAVWTSWIAYLAPSHSWDGLWYHDSIVGYAIQNQGFDWIAGAPRMEFVNGYPRMSEMFSLFAVIFSGRYLIDAVAPFMMIIAFTCMTGLVRPLGDSRVHAMGWASGLVLIPAIYLPLASTLTDVTFLAGFLAALFFVTRPRLRLADLFLGGLLAGMVGAMKGTGLLVAPLLFAIALVRLGRHAARTGDRQAWIPAAAILFSGAVLFAPTYVRNWVRTGNPVWPLKTSVLGVEFEGPQTLQMRRPGALKELFSPPTSDRVLIPDTRDNGYGNALPFLLPPLILAGLIALARDALRRRAAGAHHTLLLATLAVAPSLAVSPAGLWWARLNLHILAVGIMCAAWAVGKEKYRLTAEGILGALMVSALLTLAWTRPTWEMPPETMLRMVRRSPEQREQARLWGTMLPAKIARLRDRELGPGDVVAYDGAHKFPAGLWNQTFSNRLVYLDRGERTLERLDEIGARWVVVKQKSPLEKALENADGTWRRVGEIDKHVTAFRRPRPPTEATR